MKDGSMMNLILVTMASRMAYELGLVKRTDEEVMEMKSGMYMDLNGNISILFFEKVPREDGHEELKVGMHLCKTGEQMFDLVNRLSIQYWEYLGPL